MGSKPVVAQHNFKPAAGPQVAAPSDFKQAVPDGKYLNRKRASIF